MWSSGQISYLISINYDATPRVDGSRPGLGNFSFVAVVTATFSCWRPEMTTAGRGVVHIMKKKSGASAKARGREKEEGPENESGVDVKNDSVRRKNLIIKNHLKKNSIKW